MIAEGMVSGGIPIETVRRMVESNCDDVYHLKYNTCIGNVKEVRRMLIRSFDEQNPNPFSVPVGSEEERKKVKAYGGNPVVVPYRVAELLKEETERRFEELVKAPCSCSLTLKERFLRWHGAYSGSLPEAAGNELKQLIDELE